VSLAAGDRVGPYTVVGKIGEGGMGEVFRAHDARLKRDVALKVLPASSIGDSERRRRFEREAQVLASLNHPSIAQIFGVELDGDEPIIVMEHVDGDTLADRIKQRALPLDETIAIATQICDGLEAAHERHVIHRDLKPANIKVRPDGTIKILDFGIARVLTIDTAIDPANSPTMLGGSTDAGIILGTAAYMSPEQARGRSVDKRADIWAFGCIVFEMLTGRAVFSGESTTDILADVVKKDPDWTSLPPNTPDRLIDTLKRCLQKHPKDRARDIADVRFEIEQSMQARAGIPAAAAAKTRSPLVPLAWFAAGAALAAAAMIGMPRRSEAPALTPIRSTIVLPPDTTLTLGRGSSVALSPDGELIAFTGRSAGKTQLYLRSLRAFESKPLAGTDGASNPFFSPDGQWVAFFTDEKLKKVSIDGGAPVTVSDVLNPRGHAWGPGDEILVTPSNNVGLSHVSARGGKIEPLTTLRAGELSHRWPLLLPDGKHVLYTIWNDVGWDVSRIDARATAGGDPNTIVELGGGYPRYIRDTGTQGFLVYARSEGLLASRFDEASATATGQAIPIIDGVVTNLSGGAHFDVSPSGSLIYVPGAFAEATRDLVWITREGTQVGQRKTIRGLTYSWRLAGDGERILRNSAGFVWIDELSTGRSTRLEMTDGANFNSLWSRDGQSVVYARGLASDISLFVQSADNRRPERKVTTDRGMKSPSDLSPDGRWLLTYEIDPVSLSDIWVRDMTTGERRPFVKTSSSEDHAVFSADGQWVAYQSNESGRFEIFVRSFPDGATVTRITTEGGIAPVWSFSTNELIYRRADGHLMAVPVKMGAAVETGPPKMLFDASRYDANYAVSPDGKRVLMMPFNTSEIASVQINVVQNFLTELRQRVK
jgi:Tol biopolymer transport system component